MSTELSNHALLGRWTESIKGCVSPGPAGSVKHPLPAFETLVSFFNAAQCDGNDNPKLESRGQEMRLLACVVKAIILPVWCIYRGSNCCCYSAAVTAAGHTHPVFMCGSTGNAVGCKKLTLCLGIFMYRG